MATYIFNRLIMGKEEIGNFYCLIGECVLFFIVVVILGHNLGNSQVSVYRTIGPTLVQILNAYGTDIIRSMHYQRY